MLGKGTIELAGVDDAAAIAAMSRDLIEHGLPWRWTPRRVGRAIASSSTNVAVLRDAADLAGFGIMVYRDTDAHFVLFAVAPSHQRRGIGSDLLAWLESSARVAGAARVRAEVRWSNAAARCFYNEHGYHERVRVPGLYGDAVDGVRLEKWLRDRSSDDRASG